MAALFSHPTVLELLRSFSSGKQPKKPTPVPNILTTAGKSPTKPTPVPDITPATGRLQGTLLSGAPPMRKTLLGR